MERLVRFPSGTIPDWKAIADQLAVTGDPPALRMIDGLPALPDEVPPSDWTELRIGLTGGMITLRRHPGSVACVCWGTGDPALVRSWNLACAAVAAAGQGVVQSTGEPDRDSDAFRRDVLGDAKGPG